MALGVKLNHLLILVRSELWERGVYKGREWTVYSADPKNETFPKTRLVSLVQQRCLTKTLSTFADGPFL